METTTQSEELKNDEQVILLFLLFFSVYAMRKLAYFTTYQRKKTPIRTILEKKIVNTTVETFEVFIYRSIINKLLKS